MAAETMRAIVRDAHGVALRRIPAPVAGPGHVVVRVAVAGICRTDLRVADGELGRSPIVLGHELAGWHDGHPVTVVPFSAAGWLGVDVNGAFADLLLVPAASLRRLPPNMSMQRGAYVEPVAAAMGALGDGLSRDTRVLVAGDNRIAELTARVLAAHGVTTIVRHDPARDPAPPRASVDLVVESTGGADPADLAALAAALRPGGRLIRKSRAPVTGHGSFDAAIEWLHSGRLHVDDLLAPPRPLEELDAVLAAARASEARKIMFAIDPAEAG